MDGEAITKEEPGTGRIDIFSLDVSEAFLTRLLTDIFEEHWRSVVFGVMIQGAVFELKAVDRPRVSMLDGYMTVVFGESHFHVCIGEHRGRPGNPAEPALAHHRRTSRAELFRILSPIDGAPTSWGLRLFNGADEQQLTVFLPNPFLSEDMQLLDEPRWDRLRLWDHLRAQYLGLSPDPRDRSGTRFWHA